MEYISIVLVIFLFVIFSTNINEIQENQKQIKSKLDRIIEHLGLPQSTGIYIDEKLKEELIELHKKNKKVRAIKKLREATGMGLKEAKEYVDSL
ncbi:ribosomal protein L7/L12 [Irregularibacter muris]|uniref:Ribosomal protein L7/L12 n=1 Tax=Irregularibacter muris TaxID=1796619 RepID=A0AAE3HIT7_9FIRM|nr:ribosomal protein L7/L12 [Irregularibacter muris]MCR1899968.1 ribosomal protein L7/L12 [Irregularibacter muris]